VDGDDDDLLIIKIWDVGLRGTSKQPKSYPMYWWVPTDRSDCGWDPEREHTAQNGKWKLLDVR
jgi:hypothetical protein